MCAASIRRWLGRAGRSHWFFSSDAQQSPCYDELAGDPHHNQHALQESRPPVERRTCVNGEEAYDNKEDDHHDAGAEYVRRKTMPTGVGAHPTREYEKPGTGARECQDRADHVLWSLRRYAIQIDPGKEPCQKDTEAAHQ